MAGMGHWTQQTNYTNCGNCRICREDKSVRPHGPYFILRRRNPDRAGRRGEQEQVYLGRTELTPAQLLEVNRYFSGPQVPDRDTVLKAVGVSL